MKFNVQKLPNYGSNYRYVSIGICDIQILIQLSYNLPISVHSLKHDKLQLNRNG